MQNDNDLTILGDVHLGRKFTNNVPLHRRGEREERVWQAFSSSLRYCETPFHIQTGDLFDGFAVEEAIVLEAARFYREAAYRNKDTTYIIYRGNHDASRDTAKKSSYDVFKELLVGLPNVYVLTSPGVIRQYAFIPWHPFKTSEELMGELPHDVEIKAVFCHCDTESFGGSEANLIPVTACVQRGIPRLYTGHVHLPSQLTKQGVEVIVVGSMQPYAHGEDAGGVMYQTIPFTEFKDDGQFKYVNLRLLVNGDEIIPDVDCLSLSVKKIEAVLEDEEGDFEVSFQDFNMDTLFKASLNTAEVGLSVSEKIFLKYQELRNA